MIEITSSAVSMVSPIAFNLSNFVMTKSKKSKKIFEYLLKHKILVRTCGSFDFLDDTYIRFAVKDTNAHNKLKKALNAFC